MTRHLFTLASAISLLVCVAALVLGVRSFWVGDGLDLGMRDLPDYGTEGRFLFSARGTLGYRMWWLDECKVPADPSAAGGGISVRYTYNYVPRRTGKWSRSPDPAQFLAPLGFPAAIPQPGKRNIDFSALGLVVRRMDRLDSFVPRPYPQVVSHDADRIVGIPHWLVAVAAAAVPMVWLRRMRFRRRIANGLCPNCGYDLCATPDRCPECGTATAPQQSAMK